MAIKKKKLLTICFVIAVVTLASIIGFLIYKIDQETIPETITRDGVTLYRVEDYVYVPEGEYISCDQAINLPSCGYCSGVVEKKQCYQRRLYLE